MEPAPAVSVNRPAPVGKNFPRRCGHCEVAAGCRRDAAVPRCVDISVHAIVAGDGEVAACLHDDRAATRAYIAIPATVAEGNIASGLDIDETHTIASYRNVVEMGLAARVDIGVGAESLDGDVAWSLDQVASVEDVDRAVIGQQDIARGAIDGHGPIADVECARNGAIVVDKDAAGASQCDESADLRLQRGGGGPDADRCR